MEQWHLGNLVSLLVLKDTLRSLQWPGPHTAKRGKGSAFDREPTLCQGPSRSFPCSVCLLLHDAAPCIGLKIIWLRKLVKYSDSGQNNTVSELK